VVGSVRDNLVELVRCPDVEGEVVEPGPTSWSTPRVNEREPPADGRRQC